MNRTVTFHRLAEQELNDAAEYYESESPGLGAAFLREIQRCVQFVLDFPEAAPVVAGSVRQRLARRFPYAVLYSVRSGEVRVLAVMNLKRRPAYWVGRV